MTLAEIREAKARKVVEMRTILAKAETEKRSLTEAEQTGFDKLKGEVTALEGDEQRATFMADMERRMTGDRVTGGGDSFADVERRVSLLEVIQARTEGRELTGAAAEYAQETERRTGRKAEGVYVPMAAFETRAAQTTTTAAGIVPEDFRADQFIGPLRNALVMRSLTWTWRNDGGAYGLGNPFLRWPARRLAWEGGRPRGSIQQRVRRPGRLCRGHPARRIRGRAAPGAQHPGAVPPQRSELAGHHAGRNLAPARG